MTCESIGMKTRVLLLPFEDSSLDDNGYLQHSGSTPITITSVEGYENVLVRITMPNGEKVVASAAQLITAIQKCVR